MKRMCCIFFKTLKQCYFRASPGAGYSQQASWSTWITSGHCVPHTTMCFCLWLLVRETGIYTTITTMPLLTLN